MEPVISYEETFEDYTCTVVQKSTDTNIWYCGYVTIPNTHPYADTSYDELTKILHKENFSRELSFSCHCKFGFDTASANDHSTLNDVIKDTCKLMVALTYHELD